MPSDFDEWSWAGALDARMATDRQVQLFWAKVSKHGDCWHWLGGTIRGGYGRTWIGIGDARRLVLTHRLAYALRHGSVPHSAYVLHSCDNPPCCNPNHLELGTHAENLKQASVRGRLPNRAGEGNPRARLTWAAVEEMRAYYPTLRRNEKEPYRRAMAEKYGVKPRTIAAALARESWTEPPTDDWVLQEGAESVLERIGLL